MLDTRSRWRSAAACQSCDPDLFFPLSSSGPAVEQIARAKEICARCPGAAGMPGLCPADPPGARRVGWPDRAGTVSGLEPW